MDLTNLSSIAAKQLEYAGIIRLEAQRIEKILRRLGQNTEKGCVPDIPELSSINKNTDQIISKIIKSKVLLQAELDNIISSYASPGKST